MSAPIIAARGFPADAYELRLNEQGSSAMDHHWIVDVQDEMQAPMTTATVALVPSSNLDRYEWPFKEIASTHEHVGDGLYEAMMSISPVAGSWTLLLRAPGKSPVVQPLDMRENTTGEFLTTPFPKTAATVSFKSEVGSSDVRSTRFTVTMYPASEIVLLTGTEYSDHGTQFELFADAYRNALRRDGKIDAGTICTQFVTDKRARETHVPARGGGWLEVANKSFGSTSRITPGRAHPPVAGSDISIVDLYKYLSSVGASAPGRVKNVSIFSHAWAGGPILFNTGDRSTTALRDPRDYDGRIKDFARANTIKWPKMKNAMDPMGSWHIWGCYATMIHRRRIQKAYENRNNGEDFFFTVEANVYLGDDRTVKATIEERTTRARVKAIVDQLFRAKSYTGAAAHYLGISVFGPPPGVGSSFDDGPARMFIDMNAYATEYAYFKAEFGPHFVATNETYDSGYVDFHALASMPVVPKPAFSSEYYYLEKQMLGTPSTKLTFANDRSIVRRGTNFQLSSSAKSNFGARGLNGHLYELHDPDDATKSVAIYVQENGTLYRVTRDAAGQFTVLGRRL